MLLKTVHGSRLYGLSTEQSDYDYWEVYANRLPSPTKLIKQTITGELDVVRCNLSTFMMNAGKGSPQALETMFSDKCEIDEISTLRRNYRLDTGRFYHTYNSLIYRNLYSDKKNAARHCARLALNLRQGLAYGRFEPTLSEKKIERIINSSDDELFDWAKQILGEL